MTVSPSKTQLDFDRLAALSSDEWNHNNHYHAFLLKHLPASGELTALEIGCGTGGFSRLLAERFRRVLALDLSPRSIEIAKERSRPYANIDFQVADVMAYEFSPEQFGCIASIATLHHLPFEPILAKAKSALKIDGTLLALDLYKAESLAEFSTSLAALPVNLFLRWSKTGRLREPAEVRAAWAEHARTDVYPTLSQVRQTCARLLPDAQITRHLLWRYSIVWKKKQGLA
ncbi:MAG: class I SAM-dependent methyltransferase [Anaerolineales bacterium]